MAHRAHIELDEGEQGTPLLVLQLDERVGCERSLAPIDAERLPRLGFPLEGVQAQTNGRCLHLKQHVQLGEPFGVMEELRVRLRPLPAPGSRHTTHERVRGATRPEVERSRTLIPVGTAPTDKTQPVKPFAAVAKRSCRYVVEEAFELGLRQHALLTEQREQTPIRNGQRRERVAPAQPAHASAATARREFSQGRTSIYSRARIDPAEPAPVRGDAAAALASRQQTDWQATVRRSRRPPQDTCRTPTPSCSGEQLC